LIFRHIYTRTSGFEHQTLLIYNRERVAQRNHKNIRRLLHYAPLYLTFPHIRTRSSGFHYQTLLRYNRERVAQRNRKGIRR
jgi:hypothetical protein